MHPLFATMLLGSCLNGARGDCELPLCPAASQVEIAVRLSSAKEFAGLTSSALNDYLKKLVDYGIDMPSRFQQVLLERLASTLLKALRSQAAPATHDVEQFVVAVGIWSGGNMSFDPFNPTLTAVLDDFLQGRLIEHVNV